MGAFFDMLMSWIAFPLGYAMEFCYNIFSNYGVAIIVFTLITKIIILPIGIWVHKNSIKMVKMQPEINHLKATHYGDPDTIADEQSKLYKREKYNPLASLIPLAIQIILLLGVVAVIYHPFEYIFHAPTEVIDEIKVITCEHEGIDSSAAPSSIELTAINLIKSNPEVFSSVSDQTVLETAKNFNLSLFGYDLTLNPSTQITTHWFTIFSTIIAGLSSWLLCFMQNRINVLQSEQGKLNKWATMILSVGLSLYLGFFVPAGIALYWVASNLFAILQVLLLNQVIPPKKYVDYEALENSRKELAALNALDGGRRDPNRKREKADYKRFFSIANKHLVFYSEKSGFYKYFSNYIDALLANTNVVIHYVTNDPNDAIFEKEKSQPRIKAYYIGPKKIITFMMKMDADIVVMTTPDLDKYFIKRSYIRKDIEYIYTFHGPTSTHMCVREGAYDNFDTVFCVGPHQVRELEAAEQLYKTKTKNLIPVGFGVVDNLCKMYAEMEKTAHEKKQILIAPSWQEDNILEFCLEPLLNSLLHKGYRVILRPHPEYLKRQPARMDAIVKKYEGCDGDDFIIELDFSSNRTVWESDLLITDWSGIAYEFSYATKKPSVFINTPMKVLNPNWEKIPFVPAEIAWKDEVGVSVEPDDVASVGEVVGRLLASPEEYAKKIDEALHRNIYNLGESGTVGAKYIFSRIVDRQKEKDS